MENEDMQKMMRSIQTSLHDQISALKSDFHKTEGDVDTALEISATLEKTIHELESGKYETDELLKSQTSVLEYMQERLKTQAFEIIKAEILTYINHACSRLFVLGLMKAIAVGAQNDIGKQTKLLQLMLDLIDLNDDCIQRTLDATEAEQLNPLFTQFDDKYNELKEGLKA
jgi:cob(I)alamin adenosyltransferase